jgi:hypothetical protein
MLKLFSNSIFDAKLSSNSDLLKCLKETAKDVNYSNLKSLRGLFEFCQQFNCTYIL